MELEKDNKNHEFRFSLKKYQFQVRQCNDTKLEQGQSP